ncbi:nucleotidyltransferase family protein [Paenibacillus sp. R14(2021)]|uniref:nucleotidyltransferase family protein n=1 Tax=Paenibacillus sp. R14(2021) TaxID=2859228 RepID=UPI001C613153|nr:nucleotidyltransferase family protein [Paenibacillus sp. R14(2021)]
MMMNERDIIRLAAEDEWMMDVLRAARSLALPDWWACAGFVRSKVWDTLHGFEVRTPLPDVDIVYFDSESTDEAAEKEFERQLRVVMPDVPWSVKNQARMHTLNGNPPYASSVDAISKFPETVTALGLSMDDKGDMRLAAPCGIDDLVLMIVRPTPYVQAHPAMFGLYENRMAKKNWRAVWHRIEIQPIGPA